MKAEFEEEMRKLTAEIDERCSEVTEEAQRHIHQAVRSLPIILNF